MTTDTTSSKPRRQPTRLVELVPPIKIWCVSLDTTGIYSSEYVVESLRTMGLNVDLDGNDDVLGLEISGAVCVDDDHTQWHCFNMVRADTIKGDGYRPAQLLGKFGISGHALKLFINAWRERFD